MKYKGVLHRNLLVRSMRKDNIEAEAHSEILQVKPILPSCHYSDPAIKKQAPKKSVCLV